jgi:hypothetical protein
METNYSSDKLKIMIANKYARYRTLAYSFCFNSIDERVAICNDLDAAGIRYTLKTRRFAPIYVVRIED